MKILINKSDNCLVYNINSFTYYESIIYNKIKWDSYSINNDGDYVVYMTKFNQLMSDWTCELI